MVVDRTLYDVLGVEPDATEAEIRNAFRRKSLENHPDRGGSHEMMQKINAANEVLRDPEKRRMYDQFGLRGLQNRMGADEGPFAGFAGGSLFDLFDLFEPRRRPTQPRRGKDIRHSLKVSLEELYSGTKKTLRINQNVVCADCKGTGSSDGISRECLVCHGTGIETETRRLGSMIHQTQGVCRQCHGEGRMIDREKRCKRCHGDKVIEKQRELDIDVPHGSTHGESIRFSGQGHQIPNGESGSIFIVLEQLTHPIFTRQGNDLMMKLQINLSESLCGFQRLISLLDGHQVLINHPAGKPILPNSYQCLKGYGMPNRTTHTHGNLIVHFDVEFPPENFIVTEEQQRALESLLPPKKEVRLSNKVRYETANMEPYQPSENHSQKRPHEHHHHHHHHHHDHDMDEEFDNPYEQQRGCRMQ